MHLFLSMILIVIVFISTLVDGWTLQPPVSSPTPPQLLQSSTTNAAASRRTFLNRCCSTSLIIATTTTTTATLVNAVELDDLAMPTIEEQTALDADAIMAERIRRKVELQKERAQPKTFTESIQKERSKQKNLNSQTKEERRNAMCEELGRGC